MVTPAVGPRRFFILMVLLLGALAPWSRVAGEAPIAALTNQQAVQLLFSDVLTLQDAGVAAQIVDARSLVHTPGADYVGPVGIEHFAATWRASLTGIRFEVRELISENEKVTARWTMRGAYAGNAAATPIEVEGMALFVVQDLRIVEGWIQYDRLGLAQQLAAAGDTSSAPVAGVREAPAVTPVAAPVPRPDLCPDCPLPS